jgi:hypothetical protein
MGEGKQFDECVTCGERHEYANTRWCSSVRCGENPRCTADEKTFVFFDRDGLNDFVVVKAADRTSALGKLAKARPDLVEVLGEEEGRNPYSCSVDSIEATLVE